MTPRHKRPHAVSCNSSANGDVVGTETLRRREPDSASRGRGRDITTALRSGPIHAQNGGNQTGSRPWGREPMGTKKGSRTPSGREPVNECAGRTVNATPCRMATGLQPRAAVHAPGEWPSARGHPDRRLASAARARSPQPITSWRRISRTACARSRASVSQRGAGRGDGAGFGPMSIVCSVWRRSAQYSRVGGDEPRARRRRRRKRRSAHERQVGERVGQVAQDEHPVPGVGQVTELGGRVCERGRRGVEVDVAHGVRLPVGPSPDLRGAPGPALQSSRRPRGESKRPPESGGRLRWAAGPCPAVGGLVRSRRDPSGPSR